MATGRGLRPRGVCFSPTRRDDGPCFGCFDDPGRPFNPAGPARNSLTCSSTTKTRTRSEFYLRGNAGGHRTAWSTPAVPRNNIVNTPISAPSKPDRKQDSWWVSGLISGQRHRVRTLNEQQNKVGSRESRQHKPGIRPPGSEALEAPLLCLVCLPSDTYWVFVGSHRPIAPTLVGRALGSQPVTRAPGMSYRPRNSPYDPLGWEQCRGFVVSCLLQRFRLRVIS